MKREREQKRLDGFAIDVWVMHGFLASSLSIYMYKYVCDRREDARVPMAAATVFEPVEPVAVKTN